MEEVRRKKRIGAGGVEEEDDMKVLEVVRRKKIGVGVTRGRGEDRWRR